MKLTIEDSKKAAKFDVLFGNLSGLTDIINIYINENGLHMQGMDSSHVCLFDAILTDKWFTSYKRDAEDQEMVCVPSRIFQKVLSTYKPDQNIEININGDGCKLQMDFKGGEKTCDKYFELPTFDGGSDLMDIPSDDSDIDIIITSKKLTDLVSQFEIFDEVLSFDMSEDQVLMSASGDDGSMTAKLSLEDSQLIDYGIVEGLNLNASFSLRYIKRMTAFNKLAHEVKLELSSNKPLFMIYDIEEDSYLKLVLAPKID
uniref:Proliferating cell nuclear antigen PCNA N-terminal domain-containing protein n=1 Tax=viral metagenome TaxID=1070528 RepID=A0A6C0LJ35_9ZZZZ